MAYRPPAMRFYNRSLTIVTPFDESVTATYSLPRDRYISMLSIDVTAKLANSASSAQTMTRRQLWSIFDNITLKVNGAVGNVNVEGGRYYDFLVSLLGTTPYFNFDGTPLSNSDSITIPANSTKIVKYSIPFFFRTDVKNQYDVSSLLDARGLSSLELEYSTRSGWLPANTNVTITGAGSGVKVTLKEIYANHEVLNTINKLNGYDQFYNVYYTQQRDIALSSSSSLAANIDLNTGYIHQQIGLHSYSNSAGDWVNGIIDRYKIVHSGTEIGDVIYEEMDWEASQTDDRLEGKLTTGHNGFAMVDFETKVGRLDARSAAGVKQGDIKFYYNTGSGFSSGDLLDIMYKSLLPA
jgi:hypothetical protein